MTWGRRIVRFHAPCLDTPCLDTPCSRYALSRYALSRYALSRCGSTLLVAEVVLLEPVEIGMLVPGFSLPAWDLHRLNMGAVGLRPLQQRDVLEGALVGQRFVEVGQHRLIAIHLIWLEPPGDQSGLLEEGCVDKMGYGSYPSHYCGCGLTVVEVDRKVHDVVEALWFSP